MSTKEYSFSKSHRLLTSADFQVVFKDPIRVKSASFTVLAIETNHEQARLGVIVAKRVVKRAVQRNALKRIIRESFRMNQKFLSGFDIVVLVRAPLFKKSNELYFEELKQKWQELSVKRQKIKNTSA